MSAMMLHLVPCVEHSGYRAALVILMSSKARSCTSPPIQDNGVTKSRRYLAYDKLTLCIMAVVLSSADLTEPDLCGFLY